MREKREKIVQSFTIHENDTEDGSLEFDWIPLRENNDSVVAIGDDSLSDHPSLCPVQIRMRAEGSFGAMNYRHSISCATVRYHANQRYHIRLTLNKEAKTYSVWIAPPGRRPVQVGRDHIFLADAPECTGFRKIFLIMDRQDDCKLEHLKTGPARDGCFPSGKCGSGRNPATFQVRDMLFRIRFRYRCMSPRPGLYCAPGLPERGKSETADSISVLIDRKRHI